MKLNSTQEAIRTYYRDGEFVSTLVATATLNDPIFALLMAEAADRPDASSMQDRLQQIKQDIDNLIGSFEDATWIGNEGQTSVPLADRYANKVIKDPTLVVRLEIRGVRYANDDHKVVQLCAVNPDFYSVYVRMRKPEDPLDHDGYASAIGDFADLEAARVYATMLRDERYQRPEWVISSFAEQIATAKKGRGYANGLPIISDK